MISRNHLTISGTIVTEVTVSRGRQSGYFTIVHHSGRRIPPLYLRCFFSGKQFAEVLSLFPEKGDLVYLTAYVRTYGKGIEAVTKTFSVLSKRTGELLFEHLDQGKMYVIPADRRKIEEFRVDYNVLTLSTGEKVPFQSHDGAYTAWCYLNECIRKGYRHLFFQESTTAYGME